MYKVLFYYYSHSPRIYIYYSVEMSYLPNLGDTLTFYRNDFLAINKEILKKHYALEFKVSERKVGLKRNKYHIYDMKISLELKTELKIKKNGSR